MPSHPRADPLPSPLNTASGTPLKNKASSHHTQTYSDADPAPVVWKVKHGFRKVLHRGVGAPLPKPKLEESLFPDEILKAAFPDYEFTLESVVNHLASLPNLPDLPDRRGKREVQWANYFNAISDAVEQLTSTNAKRRWIAVYADKPVPNSKMSRKPDITLVPLDARNVWKDKDFVGESEAVHWSMFCCAGEEKQTAEARTSKAGDCLDNVSLYEILLMAGHTDHGPANYGPRVLHVQRSTQSTIHPQYLHCRNTYANHSVPQGAYYSLRLL